MADLETGRIRELKEQQQEMQKKSFTKWMNNHLSSSSLEVKDLFEDLKDGSVLRTLLETISGEHLQKLNKGNSKVYYVSNVSLSFDFLKRHNIRLVGIGPEDVVDGIPDLVLGLVWSIIQKYHITAIEIVLDSDEKKYAKEALLLWSQRRTEGYPHVKITDFSTSWRDGLAFLALIHAHRPDLVEYRHFKPADRAFNLETAFRVAEKNLGIARILDVEDMDKERPDEKSVMTYLAYYFHCFSQLDHTKRRSKKLNAAVGIERIKYTYEGKVTLLLQWLRESQSTLSSRDFPNTLHGVQQLCQQLSHFRQHEVKFRIMEYNEVIALIHSVDGRINEINNRTNNPAQSQLMPDLLDAWRKLEDGLTKREAALKRALARQEMLEQLASAFRRMVFVREESLKDPEEWVKQDSARTDFSAEAVIRRLHTLHSLTAELQAKDKLFPKLVNAAEDLRDQNYHLGEDFCDVAESLTNRYQKILRTVNTLSQQAETHPHLAQHLKRLDAFEEQLQQVKTSLGSIELDNSQMSVLISLETVAQAKTSINSIRSLFNKVAQSSSPYQKLDDVTAKFFIQRLKDFHKLFKDADESRRSMNRSLTTVLIVANLQENLKALNDWTESKKSLLKRKVTPEDYGTLVAVKESLELAQKEHATKAGLIKTIQKQLETLRTNETPASSGGFYVFEKEVKLSLACFARMKSALATQKKRLDRLLEADEFLDELDHAEKWLTERSKASTSGDLACTTVAGVNTQLHHLTRLDAELVNFSPRLDSFRHKATALIDAAEAAPKPKDSVKEATSNSSSSDSSSSDSARDEVDGAKDDFTEKTCQVMKVLYSYNKTGFSVKKGEELILVSTGDHWCAVKKLTGEEGFVPTSYLKKHGTTVVKIRSPEKPREPRNPPAFTISRQNSELNEDIREKLQNVEDSFNELQEKAKNDREELEEAKKFLTFMETCEGFRAWIKEQEGFVKAALNDTKNSEETLRNLNEYTVRVVAGETRMTALTNMATELVNENVKELNKVEETYKETAFEWNRLIGLKKKREEKLEDSNKNDEFGAQCQELKLWLEKMEGLLRGKKYGDSLQETIALIPENERLLNEVYAIKKTLEDARENVGDNDERQDALKELRKRWKALKKEGEERKDALEDTRKIHSYMKDLQDLLDGLRPIQKDVDGLNGDYNLTEALKKHGELEDVIEKQKRKIKRKELLSDDVSDDHPLSDTFKKKMKELRDSREHLQQSWEDKGQLLRRLSALRDLEVTMANMATIISKNNRVLDHLGYESLVELTRSKFELKTMEEEMDVQHKNFSKMDDALHDLQDLGNDRLLPAKKKRRKLEDDFQQLLLRINEQQTQVDAMLDKSVYLDNAENFIQWMAAKMVKVKVKVSVEDDDLESHLKKHHNLELEISFGAKQFGTLVKTGEQLLQKKKDVEVAKALDNIKIGWKELHEASAEKLIILDQANAYSVFCSKVNGINHQFKKIGAAVEEKIDDGDFDELRKRENEHKRTVQNLKFVATKIEEANTMGEKLVNAKHTASDNIKEQLKTIEEMHEKLKKAVEQRGTELRFKLDVAQLLRDVETLSDWIAAQSALVGKAVKDNKLVAEAIQRLNFLSDVRLDMSIKERSLDTILKRGDNFSRQGALQVKPSTDALLASWAVLENDLLSNQDYWTQSLGLRRGAAEMSSTLVWIRSMKTYVETIDIGDWVESPEEIEEQLQLLAVKIADHHVKLAAASSLGQLTVAQHPERKDLLDAVEDASRELKELASLMAAADDKMRLLRDLQYFLAEATAILAARQKGGRRAFCSTAHLEGLVRMAERLLTLNLSPEARLEVQKKKDLIAEKLGRRRLRRNSRSDSDSSSSDSSSDEDEVDGATKPEKLSREAQWHVNIDHVKNVIETKRKLIPKVTSGDDLKQLNKHQATLRTIEKDVIWIQPMLWEIKHEYEELQKKDRLSSEEQKACEDSLEKASAMWEAFKKDLDDAMDTIKKMKTFYDFQDEVERLMGVLKEMQEQMAQKSATESVSLLISEHGVIFSELKLRDMAISELRRRGREMNSGHQRKDDAMKLVQQLEQETLRTLEAWQKKQDYLLQCFDLEKFQKEAKGIEEVLADLDKQFSSTVVPTTLTESYQLLREHEMLQKKAAAITGRLTECRRKATAMADTKHFYADGIRERLHDLEKKLQKMEYDACVRLKLLRDEDIFIKFREDVAAQSVYLDHCDTILDLAAQRQRRIQQRMQQKTTTANNSSRRSSVASVKKGKDGLLSRFVDKVKSTFGDSSSSDSDSSDSDVDESAAILSDETKLQHTVAKGRVKKLAQFNLFLEEFVSRSKVIVALVKEGQELKVTLPRHSSGIQHLAQALLDHQARLQEALQQHRRALEIEREKENLRTLQRELRSKIRQIECAHSGDDLDDQYDELLRLKNQLDAIAQAHEDFNAEYEKNTFHKMDSVVEQLMVKDKAHAHVFAQQKTKITNRWNTAVKSLMTYRQLVGKKLDVLTFRQESDLLHEEFANIEEQLDAMSPDDDLPSIITYLRDVKNLSVLRPIVSNRVDENEKRAQCLMNRHPQETRTIGGILKETQNLYKKLKTKWDSKEKVLQHSHDVLKLEAQLSDVQKWLDDNLERLQSTELPETVVLCELAVQTHLELKIVISSRDEEIAQLQAEAKRLLATAKSKLFVKKQVQAMLETKNSVGKLWNSRRRQLEDELVLLQFQALEARLKRDLDSKQRMLDEEINYESIAAMKNELSALEATQLQPSDLEELQTLLRKLPKEKRDDLKLRVSELTARRAEILKLIKLRKEQLEAKLSLLEYLGEVDQVLPWMKSQLEDYDEVDSGISRTRLDIVKTRLKDVEKMVVDAVKTGEELAKKHMEKETIQKVVADLKTSLQQLKQKCLDDETLSDKKKKAKEYRSKAKEILSWMTGKLREHDEEDIEEELKKIKECIQVYHQLEKDGLVIKAQVDEIERHRQELQSEYPDIFDGDFSDDDSSSDDDDDDYDSARLTNLTDEWRNFMKVVKAKSKNFKNLKSAKEFAEQQEALMEWIRDMEQKMAGFLEQDFVDSTSLVVDVEACSREQDEVVREVKRRDLEVETLIATWKVPVQDPEFPMIEEVQEKLAELEEEWKALKKKVKDKKKLLNQSMEVKEMIRDLHLLDEFIDKNEEKVQLDDDVDGGSVEQVEDELRQLDQLLKQMEHYENNYKTMNQVDVAKNAGDAMQEKLAKPDRRGSTMKLDTSSSEDSDKVIKAVVSGKQTTPSNGALPSTKSNLSPTKNGYQSSSSDGSDFEAPYTADTSASKCKDEDGIFKSLGKKLMGILTDSDSESDDSDAPRTSTPRKKDEANGKTPKPTLKKLDNKKSTKSSTASAKKKGKDKVSKTSSGKQKKNTKGKPKSKKHTTSSKKTSKKTKQKKTTSSDDSSSSEASLSEFEEETFV